MYEDWVLTETLRIVQARLVENDRGFIICKGDVIDAVHGLFIVVVLYVIEGD